ncbi:MAG: DUF370 domain-containing protein [Clostridia bacterium]|nr:DUF370 domain-containing protein [Clostridia bacterium]
MYLHIGNSFTVRVKDIIGIFDFDKASVEKSTKELLRKAEKEGNLINTWEDFPKSFVIVNDRGEIKIFVSDISSASLLGRTEQYK